MKQPTEEPEQELDAPEEVTVEAMDREVLEFIRAMDDYKRLNRRQFPTWGEVLRVATSARPSADYSSHNSAGSSSQRTGAKCAKCSCWNGPQRTAMAVAPAACAHAASCGESPT